MSGCNYFTFRYESSPSPSRFGELTGSPKYFIVHQHNVGYALTDFRLNLDSGTLTGILRELPTEHMAYSKPSVTEKKANKYRAHGKEATPGVTSEVHFYLRSRLFSATTDINTEITIPFKNIEKMAVYKHDTAATTLSVVAFAGALFISVVLIAFLVSGFGVPFDSLM
jgi:hypothetical protein